MEAPYELRNPLLVEPGDIIRVHATDQDQALLAMKGSDHRSHISILSLFNDFEGTCSNLDQCFFGRGN